MSSLEANKVIAAGLTAGVAFMLATIISDVVVHPARLEKTAITIQGAPEAGAPTPPKEVPIAVALAHADPAKGEKDVQQLGCVACHTFNEGGKAGVGPNLYGIVGDPHAHMAGFAYSSGMEAKHNQPWTFDALNEWLTKPSAYIPGTKMTFAGIPDEAVRANVIDYLRTLSHDPKPLPPVPPGAEDASAAPAATPVSFDTLLASASAQKGQQDTLQLGCVACHTFNEGGKAGVGPNLYGVVGGPHAHMAGFAYSSGMEQLHGQDWTFDDLNKWLTNPAAVVKGTKMTFAGIPDEKTRADVVAYLRSLSPNPVPLPKAAAAATPAAAPAAVPGTAGGSTQGGAAPASPAPGSQSAGAPAPSAPPAGTTASQAPTQPAPAQPAPASK